MGVKEVLTSFFPPLDNGWGMFIQMPDQKGKWESEGQLGFAVNTMFGLLSWMNKQGWETKKVNETIEISPVDKQYHDLVIGQKQELEGRIKQGLGQAAVAVGDYELLLHDERKIVEFLDYFNNIRKAEEEYEKVKNKSDSDPDKIKAEKSLINAEIQTKAIFIDQIDVHNGQASLAQAVQRWPTVIVDFQSITKYYLDENGNVMDPKKDINTFADKIATKLGVSKAEGLVLAVKQKLYEEWKSLFLENLKDRYKRMKRLVEARKKSVDQYREWLKPYITRHKMITEGFSDAGTVNAFNQLPYWTSGTGSTTQDFRIWCWKKVPHMDYHKLSIHRSDKEFLVDPFDDMVRIICFGGDAGKIGKFEGWENKWKKDDDGKIIGIEVDQNKPIPGKDGKKSLMKANPGLDEKTIWEWWAATKDKNGWSGIKESSANGNGPMDPNTLYYFFMDMSINRWISRSPTGQSTESGSFEIKNHFISQNLLLVKLLEMKVDEWELQNHINELLGLRITDEHNKTMSIEQIMENKYPHLFKKDEEKKKEEEKKFSFKKNIIDPISQPFKDMFGVTKSGVKDITGETKGAIKDTFSSIGNIISGFLGAFGVEASWKRPSYGNGPYEGLFKDRITTTYLKAAGGEWGAVSGKLKEMIGM